MGSGEIIGFVDDDEHVADDWYSVVAREFADPATEFIGGPYLPDWAAPAPGWLPPGYHAAIGLVAPRPRSTFGNEFAGNLMGGNAVIRRSVFDRIGLYSTKLGRSGKGLLSEEDAEFFSRLRSAGVRGMYTPDLIIYHYLSAERLTRNDHRRWCYWRGVSQGVLDRESRKPVTSMLGVPRYMIGRAVRGFLLFPRHMLIAHEFGRAFADELAGWDLLGFIHGKHFAQIDRYYGKQG